MREPWGMSIDITDLYNAWQDGTYPNYGVQLHPVFANDQWSEFYSSNYIDNPSLRPRLVVLSIDSAIYPSTLTVQNSVVRLRRRVNRDQFTVRGTLVKDENSDGTNVLEEDVTVVFGEFSQIIPAGSFVQIRRETYRYDGSTGGITRMTMRSNGNYTINAQGLELNDIDFSNPIPLSIQVGNDRGTVNIPFNDNGRFP
jgi:hypothetical protein